MTLALLKQVGKKYIKICLASWTDRALSCTRARTAAMGEEGGDYGATAVTGSWKSTVRCAG